MATLSPIKVGVFATEQYYVVGLAPAQVTTRTVFGILIKLSYDSLLKLNVIVAITLVLHPPREFFHIVAIKVQHEVSSLAAFVQRRAHLPSHSYLILVLVV